LARTSGETSPSSRRFRSKRRRRIRESEAGRRERVDFVGTRPRNGNRDVSYDGKPWQDATHLTLVDQLLLHGEAQKFGVIRQPKILHDAVLVKGDCARCHVQDGGSLLHRVPFSKKLQDFALA
jgi:hypothetical protein